MTGSTASGLWSVAGGWVAFVVSSIVVLILTTSLRLRNDTIILAIYGLGLLPSTILIAIGTWRFTRARGWAPALGIVLATIQIAAVLACALFWLVVLALASSPYK